MKVKIIGAGSIGNHLAFSCRKHSLDVTIRDIDEAALKRTRTDTYPARYGTWDNNIKLTNSDDNSSWDLIIIGTPPDTHFELAYEIIRKKKTKALLIEKPLGPPDLPEVLRFRNQCKESNIKIFIGYNHVLTKSFLQFQKTVKEFKFKNPLQLNVFFKEHWQGIFDAHPWLSGPAATYLGSFSRGGGAGCEHSHGINAFQQISTILGTGRIHEVSCEMSMVKGQGINYDEILQMNVITESGLIGHIQQDVVTHPAIKKALCQFSNGRIQWTVNHRNGADAVEAFAGEKNQLIEIEKTRPDDFHPEIKHIVEIMKGDDAYEKSPIRIQKGIDTMLVICAAFLSHKQKKKVAINYDETSPEKTLRV